MAAARLPHPDRIRVLLTDPKLSPEELNRHGDAFLDAGRPNVAVMFYDRTGAPDRVKRVVDLAVREGDTFLLDWAARVRADSVSADDWRRCGQEAMNRRRLSFAVRAFARAGDDAKATEAREALMKALGSGEGGSRR